jgi:putative membrane protein insertion efficiency factor
MKGLALTLISVYQRYLRYYLPPSCRFHPSCSEYSKESIERFGLIKGILLTLKRIVRCHPLCAGGHDPVPQAGRK